MPMTVRSTVIYHRDEDGTRTFLYTEPDQSEFFYSEQFSQHRYLSRDIIMLLVKCMSFIGDGFSLFPVVYVQDLPPPPLPHPACFLSHPHFYFIIGKLESSILSTAMKYLYKNSTILHLICHKLIIDNCNCVCNSVVRLHCFPQ